MDILPRHVICILGEWSEFKTVEASVAACGDGFVLDREYSQLSPDDRMPEAFAASMDRFNPTLTNKDWRNIDRHTAVAYVLSPPLRARTSESISARAIQLIATLLGQGGLAAKSESSGLAHGRERWIDLSRKYDAAVKTGDTHSASATLYWAWVQRVIHDQDARLLYSCGMHLLGQRDTEVDDSVDHSMALEWIDLMGLYLIADKPGRPLCDGEGFRLRSKGPRRIIKRVPCERYEGDDFFYNPYGYHRLVKEG